MLCGLGVCLRKQLSPKHIEKCRPVFAGLENGEIQVTIIDITRLSILGLVTLI
jgi:hypothetical protein